MATNRRTDARGEPPVLKRSQAAVAEAKKAWREKFNKRLQKCLAQPMPLMENDIFAQALEDTEQGEQLRQEILAPAPQAQKPPRRTKAPKGLPPYLASLYDTVLLTREQEAHFFRKMNFLKYWANKIRDDIKPNTAGVGAKLSQFEALVSEAAQIRSAIVKANLRLVVSIAKRYNTQGDQNRFFEMVSDGNMSLFQAVEKFDYARGNKFSTYASWAIEKNFQHAFGREKVRQIHVLPHHKVMGSDDGDSYTWEETIPDTRTDELAAETQTQLSHDMVQKILESTSLDRRERLIVMARFGLNGHSHTTLTELGRMLGITKERVRQLETRALEKLQKTASSAEFLHSGSFRELEVVEC